MKSKELRKFKVGDCVACYEKEELCWVGVIESLAETFGDWTDICYMMILVRIESDDIVTYDYKPSAWRRDTLSNDTVPFDKETFDKMVAIYKKATESMELELSKCKKAMEE